MFLSLSLCYRCTHLITNLFTDPPTYSRGVRDDETVNVDVKYADSVSLLIRNYCYLLNLWGIYIELKEHRLWHFLDHINMVHSDSI